MIVTIGFLPTRPQGARRRFSVSATTPTASFYPRARGGRDRRSRRGCAALPFLSTRPRGARPAKRREAARRRWVSIHAPAGGATRKPVKCCRSLSRFLSTRPRGARRRRHRPPLGSTPVSIHAPAGGATYVKTNKNE